MFSLTLSALEYPVLKCCFTASSSARSALDASDAPGTPTEQRRLFALFLGVEELQLYFRLERLVFPPGKKVFSFLLIIFSTPLAKASPKGIG